MADTKNALIKSVLDYAYSADPNFLFYVGRADIENQMQIALDKALPNELTLASEKPDFEAILLKFVQELEKDNAWKDVLHVGTGQTLLRNISAGLSYLHFAIVRATHNTFLRPNATRAAVYASMNMLGVSVRRKIPQEVLTRISIPEHFDPFTIPRFTQFNINGIDYFNREALNYTEFDLFKDITLYQGTIMRMTGKSTGIPYETIEIGAENYAVSDTDVYAFVNGREWLKDELLKPWLANKDDELFFVRSEDTGNVQVKFGNGIFGKIPPIDQPIQLLWAETLGADAKLITTGSSFSLLVMPFTVTGETLGSSFGGDNELSTEFYAQMGPHMRSADKTAIRRTGFKTVALNYPDIKDALFRGQAEIAPGKRNWMNVVEATVLTGSGKQHSPDEWNVFINYMKKNCVENLEFIRRDPIFIEIAISADIYCVSEANLTDIKARLINDVLAYTKPKRGSIGYSIYRSDIVGILEGKYDLESQTDYSKIVEYSRNLEVRYVSSETEALIPPGTGINAEGDIIADFLCYVTIRNVDLNLHYTPRRTYTGRTDLRVGM